MGSMKYLGVFFAVILAASLFCIQPAGAAIVDVSGSSLNGNDVSDFSGAGKIDIQTFFYNPQEINLKINLGAEDAGLTQIALAGFINNVSDASWKGFSLTLSGGAAFAGIGDITTLAANGAGVTSSGNLASISFQPTESLGFVIGAPGGVSGTDWLINLNGLGQGNSFNLTLTPESAPVPLPPSVLMFLSGLGVTGFFVRRRFTWM